MVVTLKFVGALRHMLGAEKLRLNFERDSSIKELINEITREKPQLKRTLVDQQSDGSIPNALILVNGTEISIFKGLETKIKDGDEIVFVPVVHGG
jgi:sulfur-carrier protein